MRPPLQFAAAMPVTRRALLALLPLALNACATIAHGRTQEIAIVSDPPGAQVSIDSRPVGTTPMLATVARKGQHQVTVSYDTFPAMRIPLRRSLSRWVWVNAYSYGLTAPIDFATGAAYKFRPDTVRAVFAVSPAVAARARAEAAARWQLAPGTRMTLDTARTLDSAFQTVEGVVDSVVADRVYLHPQPYAPPGAQSGSVDLRGARRIAVYREADRGVNASSGMHYAALFGVLPVLASPFFIGAPIVTMPWGWLLGALSAQPRWAPIATLRTGSPLLLEDRVRLTTGDANGWTVRGRLADADSASLMVSTAAGVTRVPRADIQSLQRAHGFNFKGAALGGIIGGGVLGTAIGVLAGGKESTDAIFGFGFGALVGLIYSPAFAPRRWADVHRW